MNMTTAITPSKIVIRFRSMSSSVARLITLSYCILLTELLRTF